MSSVNNWPTVCYLSLFAKLMHIFNNKEIIIFSLFFFKDNFNNRNYPQTSNFVAFLNWGVCFKLRKSFYDSFFGFTKNNF